MKINGVLFDLDDTLYDRRLAFRAWAEGFIDSHLEAEAEPLRAETVDLLVELDDNGYGPREALFWALKKRHPALSHDVDDLISLFRRDFPAGLALDDGARSLLQALADRAIPFGIITNGLAHQRPKLTALGVDRMTSCIFVSSEFGCKKPDRRIFDAAAKELGVPAGEILFVGDHPMLDICGASHAGMKTAWLARHGAKWPQDMAELAPDFKVSSLGELVPLFS